MLWKINLGKRMVRINWDEYKEFKAESNIKGDNFVILINFMRSYYNMSSPRDMFESFANDDLALMMLQKREIESPADLEHFLFKM
jgi:hypothetical protein